MKLKLLKVKGITVGLELSSENSGEKKVLDVIYERKTYWAGTSVTNGVPDSIQITLNHIPFELMDD